MQIKKYSKKKHFFDETFGKKEKSSYLCTVKRLIDCLG